MKRLTQFILAVLFIAACAEQPNLGGAGTGNQLAAGGDVIGNVGSDRSEVSRWEDLHQALRHALLPLEKNESFTEEEREAIHNLRTNLESTEIIFFQSDATEGRIGNRLCIDVSGLEGLTIQDATVKLLSALEGKDSSEPIYRKTSRAVDLSDDLKAQYPSESSG